MREVRQDATLIIGACRGVGGVASWSVIKAMQKVRWPLSYFGEESPQKHTRIEYQKDL